MKQNMKQFAAVSALVLASLPVANATPALELISGSDVIFIADNGPKDLTPTTDGVVTWSGKVGDWLMNVSSGVVLGTANKPIYDSLSFDLKPTSPNVPINSTLEILFSDVNLGPLNAGSQVTAAIGGNFVFSGAGSSISYSVYTDTGNSLFAKTTPLTPTLTPVVNPVSKEFSAGEQVTSGSTIASPYSMTLDIVINGVNATAVSYDAKLHVPDGGYTLMLLGTGMTVLGGIQLRRKQNLVA